MSTDSDELSKIEERYKRRSETGVDKWLYRGLDPHNALWRAELAIREAQILNRWLGPSRKLSECAILEIGCGAGQNLLDMIRLGANPSLLLANELRSAELEKARSKLPSTVKFFPGDLLKMEIAPSSVDLVLQFTVLSSILDPDFRKKVAERMWSWLNPGGAILSYDFVYNNPHNPDVLKVSLKDLQALFPAGAFEFRRVTLAPPLARRIAPRSEGAFHLLNALGFLRSHALCLITKPRKN